MMQQELSSGFEDCDSEEISGKFKNENYLNDLTKKSPNNYASPSQLPVSENSIKEILTNDLIQDADFFASDVTLTKQLEESSSHEIKFDNLDSEVKDPIDHLEIYQNQAFAVQKELSKINGLLNKVERHQDEKEVQIHKLSSVLNNLAPNDTENFRKDQMVEMEKQISNLEKNIELIKEEEIMKRNKLEAEYVMKLSDFKRSEESLREELTDRIVEIQNLKGEIKKLKCQMELHHYIDINEYEALAEAVNEKVSAKLMLETVENELRVRNLSHEAEIKTLKKELSEQIAERQKNDYRKIFLEDQVAMLTSKCKMIKKSESLESLNLSVKSLNHTSAYESKESDKSGKVAELKERLLILQSFISQKEERIEELQQEVEEKEFQLEEYRLKILNESSMTEIPSDCNICGKLRMKLNCLEYDLQEINNAKLELERRMTSLLQEKMKLANNICEAGRLNSELREKLEATELRLREQYEFEINALSSDKEEILEQCSVLERKLSQKELQLITANHELKKVEHKVMLTEEQHGKHNHFIDEIKELLEDVASSQKSMNSEQISRISELFDSNFTVPHFDGANEYENNYDVCDEGKKLVKYCGYESSDPFHLKEENDELRKIVGCLKEKLRFLKQKLITSKEKFAVYIDKKDSMMDSLVQKYTMQKINLQQELEVSKIKEEFTQQSNDELNKRLSKANNQLKEDAEKIISLESQNIELVSSVKQKELLLELKESELEQMKKKYDTIYQRFEDLSAKSVDLNLQNSKFDLIERNEEVVTPQWGKYVQGKLDSLCHLTEQQNKFLDQSVSKDDPQNLSSNFELEFLRYENSRLKQNLEVNESNSSDKEEVDDLINRSHLKALSILSSNNHSIVEMHSSSPTKSSN